MSYITYKKKLERNTVPQITHIVYQYDDERVEVELTEETRTIIMEAKKEEESLYRKERRQRRDCMKAISQTNGRVRMIYLDSDEGKDIEDSIATLEMERLNQRLDIEYAIRQISTDQQTVIQLVFLEDVQPTEITERTGWSKSSISHKKKRGLESLRKISDESVNYPT